MAPKLEKIKAQNYNEGMEKIFCVKGMHCAACAVGLERFLGMQQGVLAVSVNAATERMNITYDEALVTDETLKTLAQKLSYTLEDYVSPTQMAEEDRRRAERETLEQWRAQKRRVLFCCVFSVLLLVTSIPNMLGLEEAFFVRLALKRPLLFGLGQLILALPVAIMGRDFYQKGIPALFRGQPTMDSLVALGTGSAWIYSLFSTVMLSCGHEEYGSCLFYDSSAVVITLVLLGKSLENRSKNKAGSAIRALKELLPETAVVTRYGVQAEIPACELRVGDVVIVSPGAHFPCDGVILDGASTVDNSLLTGESIPVSAAVGDSVTGGAINGEGLLTVEVQGVGDSSRLHSIITLVEDAQGRKAPIAKLADRIAAWFVPAVLLAAALSAGLWAVNGKDFVFVVRIFIAVLVVACPCSLGLATPTAILCGTGRAAQLGILFTGGEALQRTAEIDLVVFDKTGTVTEGQPAITGIYPEGISAEELMQILVSVEQNSSHPLGKSVCRWGENRGVVPAAAENVTMIPGLGIRAVLSSQRLCVGSRELLRQEGVFLDGEPSSMEICCGADGVYLGRVEFSDPVRPDSAAAVSRLKSLGIKTVMLSGDNPAETEKIACALAPDDYRAGLLPSDKADEIRRLKAEGNRVLMVGDGVNDAPSLAEADVGIAMGCGTDVALSTAQIVLTENSLSDAVEAIRLSKAVMRNIRQNLFWALIYNACTIPFAAGVIYAFGGPLMHPMICGAAMAFSSIFVVSNALRLLKFQKQSG